ncbi:FG-GAP-like repeat-containing protein [Paraglaciecola hydrolytica]|nr:FG-GAP-like repeat-containing protein [Paraglaciecola hydrolytica]
MLSAILNGKRKGIIMLQQWQLSLKQCLILGLLNLSLASVHLCAHAANSSLFNEHQITLPFNLTQPVYAANLLTNPGNEMLLLGVNESGQRQFAIYALNANNQLVLMDHLRLDNSLFAFDVGTPDKNGQQQLYFLSKDQLFQYQFVGPAAEPIKPSGPMMAAPQAEVIASIEHSNSRLVAISKIKSMYLSEKADAIITLDFAKDINNDLRDDFVLPHFEQLNLYLSGEDATQLTGLKEQHLNIRSLLRVDGADVRFKPSDLLFVDMDLDTRNDIVLVESGQLRVYQQTLSGDFNPEPLLIKVAAEIEGINWWDKIDVDGQQVDQSQLKHRSVETITDVNGDALPDLIVRFTQSSGVLDRTNDYEFYYASVVDGHLSYALKADTRIQSDSTLSDFKWFDLDGDGKQEIMLSSFDLSLSQIISALLSSSIEQEVLIFKMDENNLFPAKPTASQDVEITFSLSSGRSGEPMVKAQDIDGDKFKDLIFSEGEEEIKVLFASRDGKRLFNKRAEKHKVQVPKNAKSITHNDLNNDGKMDLILHYSRADAADLLNKVIVLIAN